MIVTPDSELIVDGDASTVDNRCSNVGVSVTGSVASVEGDVSLIVLDGELTQDVHDALQSEFGVSWSEQS